VSLQNRWNPLLPSAAMPGIGGRVAGVFRLAGRGPALVAITGLAALRLVFGLPRMGGDPRRRARLQESVFERWARRVLPILGVRVFWSGETPTGRVFLVANHVSYLDIPVLASRVPCSFVAKAEIAGWPIAGTICRAVDTLFIDRSRKRDLPRVLGEVRRLLDVERAVTLFPEGTTGSGDGLLPFRSSLLDLPASLEGSVAYAVLHYRAPPGWPPSRESIAWWGKAPLLPHALRLLQLPWIEVHVRVAEQAVVERDRKHLTEALESSMARELAVLEGSGSNPTTLPTSSS
jgi:1-acyl-sn-glycerol-3-phosphate acyltransferase